METLACLQDFLRSRQYANFATEHSVILPSGGARGAGEAMKLLVDWRPGVFGQTRRHSWSSRSHLPHGAIRTAPPEWPLHPVFRRLPPPVIVVGMHGSGSSVVSQILGELGVYMGSQLDSHAEAAEFFQLNEELLYRAGAAWCRSRPMLAMMQQPAFRASGAVRLAAATYGSLRTRFLSDYNPAAHALWGWKDPRNSLTLPLWLQLFPHARVLHVLREPEHAARSIHRRAVREADSASANQGSGKWHEAAARMLLYPPAAVRYVQRSVGQLSAFPTEDPCLDLGHCLELAHDYVNACYRYRDLGGPRLEVRYEQLLERPLDTVQTLAAFTLGNVPEARIAAATALVRRGPRSQDAAGSCSGARATPVCPGLKPLGLS